MVKTHHNRVYFVEYRSPNPYSFLPSYQFLTELVTGKEPQEGDEDMNLAEWAWRYFCEVNSMVEALDPKIKTVVVRRWWMPCLIGPTLVSLLSVMFVVRRGRSGGATVVGCNIGPEEGDDR
ncbi:unnamed protein product [Lactuca saligna]|uniref:Uncharacterized protein n=1 Tax=Lactuca saligna TaxID=75948 RepID=A0AA36EID8_LACSI|nr:unnamed protein product [Lactuca saligna]